MNAICFLVILIGVVRIATTLMEEDMVKLHRNITIGQSTMLIGVLSYIPTMEHPIALVLTAIVLTISIIGNIYEYMVNRREQQK